MHHAQASRRYCRTDRSLIAVGRVLEIDAESEKRPVNRRLQAEGSLGYRVTDLEMQQCITEAQAEVFGESPVELGIRSVRHIGPNSKPAAITVQVEAPFLPKVLSVRQSDKEGDPRRSGFCSPPDSRGVLLTPPTTSVGLRPPATNPDESRVHP